MSRRKNRLRRLERLRSRREPQRNPDPSRPLTNFGDDMLGPGVRCRSCGREIMYGRRYYWDLDGQGGIFCNLSCFNSGGVGGNMATHYKRSFELVGDGHDKFWTVEVVGSHFLVTYGRNGTNGKTQHTDMGTHAAAQAEADKKIREKMNKGYVPVTGKPGAAASIISPLLGRAGPLAPAPAPTPPPPSAQPGTRYLDLDE